MATQGKNVTFFGDSLSDVSVLFDALVASLTAQEVAEILAGIDMPTPAQIAQAQQQAAAIALVQASFLAQSLGAGPQNAVTNEFTHVTYFEQITGANVENFANAGARALGSQEPFGTGTGYDSNLGAQLTRFFDSRSGPLDPSSKAVLYIGSNDFSDILGAASAAPGASVFSILGDAAEGIGLLLTALEGAARSLDAAGTGTIYFGTLPLGSFFPGSDALDDLSSGLSDFSVATYNLLLSLTAASLRSEGIDVQMIDYAAVARAATEDPGSFGIVADRADFLVDGSTFDSDQVGFWDPIHPAEAAHQAWGAYGAFVMEGGSTAALNDFGNLNVGSNGANAVFAYGGSDTVLALGGDDVVFSGSGNDQVLAGSGNDIVSGGSGNDVLLGQSGNDIIDGGAGNDTILGSFGNDVIIDGLGSDLAHGGFGDDVFIYVEGTLEGDASATLDAFRGGFGNDTLYLVLDDASFDTFQTSGAQAVLTSLGISTSSVENILAIDGRGAVESELSGESWFLEADFWGLVPAPTPDIIA